MIIAFPTYGNRRNILLGLYWTKNKWEEEEKIQERDLKKKRYIFSKLSEQDIFSTIKGL